jgi:hypothetical protein
MRSMHVCRVGRMQQILCAALPDLKLDDCKWSRSVQTLDTSHNACSPAFLHLELGTGLAPPWHAR